MKKIIMGTLTIILLSSYATASTKFTCVTKSEERYYVKQKMSLEVINKNSITVTPYDTEANEWNSGSNGKADKIDTSTGWVRFSDFDSSDMFGDLSEGTADSIYIYVSPTVLSGAKGPISLYAHGSEVGLEKATYFCNPNQ